MPRERIGRKAEIARHKLFLELLPDAQTVGEAYVQAGFTAKSDTVARVNGCRLLRQLDEKLGYREIFNSIGLSDRHLATRIKDLVDDKDGHLSVKACGLASRCKNWLAPNVSVGIGVEINITQAQAQAQDDIIDVTSSALDDLPPDEEQVLD